MNGKGDARRPSAVPQKVIDERWERTFAARRELRTMMRETDPSLCHVCKGEGRDPDHWKNACPECGGDGRIKEAA